MLKLESEKADLQWRIDGERLNVPLKLDADKLQYWFENLANGDIQEQKNREMLVDAFINKVIVWNDKVMIVFNVLGANKDKVTVEYVLNELQEKTNPERFVLSAVGAPARIRTWKICSVGRLVFRTNLDVASYNSTLSI